jgi:E3 ubiquitin-protein ligase synoviolin
LYLTIRSVPPQPTSIIPQSEASSSNQSQKDQELQFQNTSDGLAPQAFNTHGAISSGTSTRDFENSLQKAQENFIKSQIEVRILDSKSTKLAYFYITL